jgi:hypothetical protein
MILLTMSLLMAAQPAAAKPVEGDEKMVCRKIARTGSRLPARRVCMTQREWLNEERTARRDYERMRDRGQAGDPLFAPQ